MNQSPLELLRDPRVPRRAKVALALLGAYLAFPLDLIPDFIPVLGQLDDVVIAAFVLRYVSRVAGEPVQARTLPSAPA